MSRNFLKHKGNKLKEVNLNLNQNPVMVWGFYSDCFCWHPNLTLEANARFSKLNAGLTSWEGLAEATRLTPQVPTGTACIPWASEGTCSRKPALLPLLPSTRWRDRDCLQEAPYPDQPSPPHQRLRQVIHTFPLPEKWCQETFRATPWLQTRILWAPNRTQVSKRAICFQNNDDGIAF